MRIKSYFSGTVESAMELASRELGDEAVILNSRPAPAEARHLGAYEVVFGVDETSQATSRSAPGLGAQSAWSPNSSSPKANSLLGGLPPSISGISGSGISGSGNFGSGNFGFGNSGISGDSGETDPGGGRRGHRFELLEGEIVALRQELRKMSRGILAPASHWKDAGLSENEASLARANREAQELVAYLVQRDLPEGAAGELVRRGRERLRKGIRGGGAGTLGGASGSGDGWRREDVGVRNQGLGHREKGLFSNGSGVFPAHPGVLAGLFAEGSPLAAAVLDQLAAVLRVDATLGRPRTARETGVITGPNISKPQPGGSKPTQSETKVVALVGGAGVGKTTTLVKLAAHYGLRARRPTHIISTDNLRVGAAEQLRSYAAILGVGFDLAETATALGQLLNEHANKDLILIDTPGQSPGQMEDGAAVARFLGTDPRVDCHLVVPAYQKGADVTLLLDRFHAYGASKVILTRLDETEAIGGLLLALDESEARISFLSMGQTIPEDLEPASVARLLDLFVGDPPMGAFLMARESDDREDLGFDALRAEDRRAQDRGPDGLGLRDEVPRTKGRPETMATAGTRR